MKDEEASYGESIKTSRMKGVKKGRGEEEDSSTFLVFVYVGPGGDRTEWPFLVGPYFSCSDWFIFRPIRMQEICQSLSNQRER